jgi:hypothetical protein
MLLSLPTELLHQTLENLPADGFLELLESSPEMRERLDDHSWRNRVARDMPYLWEIVDQSRVSALKNGPTLDWEQVYKRLLQESFPEVELDRSKPLHLPGSIIASRRRIWDCAQQILACANLRGVV